jgi:penicillin amidase
MKWVLRIGGLLLALLVAAAATALFYRHRVLPLTQGTLVVPGLQAEVRIERDRYGIPTISAGSMRDALFGLGFVHAQDRLWQLETHRRIGAGRLAEAFGPAAVESDRFLRALGVRRAAAAQLAQLDAADRAALEAYAAGVNSFVRGHLRARPPEFLLLGLHPAEWEPVDSTAWAIMMAWDLGGNWNAELLRLRLTQQLPVARINELLPPYPGTPPLETADYAQLVREWQVNPELGRHAQLAAPPSGIEGVGSNNWVVAGSHTRSGKPLLANDPHLKLTAPALWYFARLRGPGFNVAGATMPGLPAVVLGQNEHIAWGYTNTAPDVQDLYLERIHPEDPTQYQTPDGWARFQSFDEVIRVKGGADVKLTVRATRHGPVISDAGVGPAAALLGQGKAEGPARHALALRWTALDPQPGTLQAALRIQQARSAQEFIAAAELYDAPMQNMVVADAQGEGGNIAFVAAGRVPLRRADNDLKGLVPAPGWDARYDWDGFLAPTLTPRETNPPRGWIATANQRIHAPDYPHFITSEWAMPYRQQRIEQLLGAEARHDTASMMRMQGDVLSLSVQRLLPVLQRARSTHPLAAAAMAELAAFDGTMAADRAAPAIYHVWARHLSELVMADELGPLWNTEFSNYRSFREGLEAMIARDDAWWCDDKKTIAPEACAQMADKALTRALDELATRLGTLPATWRWGDLHVARSEHRPFSRVGQLAPWFELRAPVGGDTHTVNVSRVNMLADRTTGERYLSEHGPSLRAVYDLADRSRSRFIHSGGQSGIALSPHYRTFVADWAAVRYVPVWDDPQAGARETLVLQPTMP